MVDKTSYLQSLTHMIKGNLGAGVLAMPVSFMHLGLVGAVFGLPFLCIISAYCVHLLVNSSRKVEIKSKGQKLSQDQVNYARLARGAFELGPEATRKLSEPVGFAVDTCLLVTQIGVCCVYIIFVVENVATILASYHIMIPKTLIYLAVFPVTLLLSFIRTLARLSVASLLANLLQIIGLALTVEYLLRDLNKVNLAERDNFRPISEMALGFGSAMFAFEGISVVLPLYSKLRHPRLMSASCGVINVSFFVVLTLYFVMGLIGFLKYGHHVCDSITLNLPATPLYDAVRAMFTVSILLSYPLQFYVPNEIIWNWAKKNLMKPRRTEKKENCVTKGNFRSALVAIPPGAKTLETIDDVSGLSGAIGVEQSSPIDEGGEKLNKSLAKFTKTETVEVVENPITNSTTTKLGDNEFFNNSNTQRQHLASNGGTKLGTIEQSDGNNCDEGKVDEEWPQCYEYYCRLIIVVFTFTLALSVPRLNLLMDLIGSLSGVALCLTIPAMIHLAAFWDDTKGPKKALMILIDGFLIIGSICAGTSGSLSSLASIVQSFNYH